MPTLFLSPLSRGKERPFPSLFCGCRLAGATTPFTLPPFPSPLYRHGREMPSPPSFFFFSARQLRGKGCSRLLSLFPPLREGGNLPPPPLILLAGDKERPWPASFPPGTGQKIPPFPPFSSSGRGKEKGNTPSPFLILPLTRKGREGFSVAGAGLEAIPFFFSGRCPT